MNVLLKLAYKGRKAGTLLKDVPTADALALEALGLGEILKEEEPKEEPRGKGGKVPE